MTELLRLFSNNSFIEANSLDGVRKHLAHDFNLVYLVDLKGNVRQDSMREGIPIGENHTVFGLSAMVGISISFFVKKKIQSPDELKRRGIYYVGVDWKSKRVEKFRFIDDARSVYGLKFKSIEPDNEQNWLTEGMVADFKAFLPLFGEKNSIFLSPTLGVSTNRDSTVYDFSNTGLLRKVEHFARSYNSEVSRYFAAGKPGNLDSFVDYNEVKWSEKLKRELRNHNLFRIEPNKFRSALYRPFTTMQLCYSDIVIDRPSKNSSFFPTAIAEKENLAIYLSGKRYRSSFSTLVVSRLADLHLCASADGFTCLSFFEYQKNDASRIENITDWALERFREHYARSKIQNPQSKIEKWDIFYYIYAILHHPKYRKKYAANLKRELPRIPFAPDFWGFARAGRELADIHVNYEDQPEYKLEMIENPKLALDWRVEKMRYNRDKTAIIYNDFLTLQGIPPDAHDYRLGNRSALDWIVDQYKVSTDKRSGITNDPNREGDPQYIVRLIKKIVTVSLRTNEIVKNLPEFGF